jgi:YHS domain-containing protein
LEILPILMEFEKHADVKFPLDNVDREALARWIDDRIVAFVRTYLSVHENNHYLKGHLVQDPIAGVSFPKYAAGATLERGGTTYYFIGEETRREFEKKQPAPAKTK